jgi:hypothetical protein
MEWPAWSEPSARRRRDEGESNGGPNWCQLEPARWLVAPDRGDPRARIALLFQPLLKQPRQELFVSIEIRRSQSIQDAANIAQAFAGSGPKDTQRAGNAKPPSCRFESAIGLVYEDEIGAHPFRERNCCALAAIQFVCHCRNVVVADFNDIDPRRRSGYPLLHQLRRSCCAQLDSDRFWNEHAPVQPMKEEGLFEEYQVVERAAICDDDHCSRMRPSSRCAARSRSTSSSVYLSGTRCSLRRACTSNRDSKPRSRRTWFSDNAPVR